ncbi:hypothetical protein GCM10009740_12840 [Terrabacter terrae]|uniref:Chemotaxis protein n=1 Tax=Terrabacter terrae TaxID=318434 RepID=A0ABN2TY14_9MICO
MSNIDESGAGMADSDINSTHPDGSGSVDTQSAVEGASGDDAGRGNLDGSTPVAEPRGRSLDQAGSEAGGNGSFDEAAPEENGAESDAVDAGQDNGLNE